MLQSSANGKRVINEASVSSVSQSEHTKVYCSETSVLLEGQRVKHKEAVC